MQGKGGRAEGKGRVPDTQIVDRTKSVFEARTNIKILKIIALNVEHCASSHFRDINAKHMIL